MLCAINARPADRWRSRRGRGGAGARGEAGLTRREAPGRAPASSLVQPPPRQLQLDGRPAIPGPGAPGLRDLAPGGGSRRLPSARGGCAVGVFGWWLSPVGGRGGARGFLGAPWRRERRAAQTGDSCGRGRLGSHRMLPPAVAGRRGPRQKGASVTGITARRRDPEPAKRPVWGQHLPV